jgi:hypothetical protein
MTTGYQVGPPSRTTPSKPIGELILAEIRELRSELGELRDELGATNRSIERISETVNSIDAWVDEQK